MNEQHDHIRFDKGENEIWRLLVVGSRGMDKPKFRHHDGFIFGELYGLQLCSGVEYRAVKGQMCTIANPYVLDRSCC